MTDADRPDATPLPDFDPLTVVELDVRGDLRSGREPLTRILAAADAVPPDGVLHLRSPFYPAPLVRLLAQRGFSHHSKSFGDDDWSTWFWRGDAAAMAAPPVVRAAAAAPAGVIDLRDLPPPEPLFAILDRIARGDAPFDVLLPFDPPILDALLQSMGWRAERIAGDTSGTRLRIQQTFISKE